MGRSSSTPKPEKEYKSVNNCAPEINEKTTVAFTFGKKEITITLDVTPADINATCFELQTQDPSKKWSPAATTTTNELKATYEKADGISLIVATNIWGSTLWSIGNAQMRLDIRKDGVAIFPLVKK